MVAIRTLATSIALAPIAMINCAAILEINAPAENAAITPAIVKGWTLAAVKSIVLWRTSRFQAQ